MKKKNKKHGFSMRKNLILLMMLEMGAITMIGWLVTKLMTYLHVTVVVPDIVWLMMVSVLLGAATTAFLSKWVFAPVTRLGKAMEQVSKGKFDVRLKEKHRFDEMEEIYHNFNMMTQELQNTEILQTDFVSNVSHEFKTPINAIEGYAMLLQDTQQQMDASQREYVDKILYNTGRLSALVGNILLLSKVDNQAILGEGTVFRLDEQIRQAILHLESKWEQKDIWLEVDMQEISYTAEQYLLMHVWTNLIDNAVKFSPLGGCVSIGLKLDGEQIVFTIQDQGEGIAKEAQNHIFDRFYQSDSSHKAEGNGLGLALVKQILDLHNGKIFAENIPQGGCRFTVYLPYSQ